MPGWVGALLALPGLGFLSRLFLASPFIGSGIGKLLDMPGAAAEAAALGLQPAALVAAFVIAVQLGGSALILTRRWCWLGAGLLAGFTVVATLIAHSFWRYDGLDRVRQTATFLEHVAIAGGILAASLLVHRRPP